jgi:uncharacterized protein (TIGR03083 family)
VDREACWRVIEQQRLAIADLLEDLSAQEWDAPSLCAGWRIRDVAAHIAMTPQAPGPWTMLVEAVRARGSFHRLNHDIAVRHANRPGADLVAELRRHAASRKLPAVTSYRNVLADTLVHAQDMAIPLRRTLPMPTEAAATAATRVWTMGWPFHAKRRLAGFRLTATDTTWTAGNGTEIRGPTSALLLLLTGRTESLRQLSGEGLAVLPK